MGCRCGTFTAHSMWTWDSRRPRTCCPSGGSPESARSFRYRALVDGGPFVARLEVDEFGRVVSYEGLWEMVDDATR